MTWISDQAILRLRQAAEFPDLSSTPYRVLSRLASGGMGTVYLAEDARLNRTVAIKITNIIDDTGSLAARLRDEARVIARLEHPGIVPVHDFGTLTDGRVFYVMKFVRGKSLSEHLKDAPLVADRLRIFERVCEAVAFAHSSGVIHRDLKPENVMVGEFGEVLVMDWGVARINSRESRVESPESERVVEMLRSSGDTAHGTVVGTPAYMAPEQAEGETHSLDHRADIYSLGAVLYFLLTERPPAMRDQRDARSLLIPPRQLKPDVPRALEAICLKSMSYDRAKRYASVQELYEDVKRFLDGQTISAYRENIIEQAGRWLGKNRFIVLLILAYLVMRIFVLLALSR